MSNYSINKVKFDGFDAVEVVTSSVKLVLVYGIGPRIAYFGKTGGDNLLFWRTEDNGNGWKLYGGHRVWITRPFADESVDTYITDNDPCRVDIGANYVEAIAPASTINNIERGIRVEILSDDELLITNSLTNVGNLIYSGAVWNPTCVVPDGKDIVVPLGSGNITTWDVVKMAVPLIFAGNTTCMEDSQITYEGNNMILRANGKCVKRVVQGKQGIVKLLCDGYEFVKYSPYDRYKNYPFDGCNLAVFNGDDNWMAEMESFGHEGEILPGDRVENSEHWILRTTNTK